MTLQQAVIRGKEKKKEKKEKKEKKKSIRR
jgi:hypothetical protein